MRIACFILSSFLPALGLCLQKYSLFQTYLLPLATDKIVFSGDLSRAILYGNSSRHVNRFSGYNWTLIISPIESDLHFPPTLMESYTIKNDIYFLYSSDEGNIRRRAYDKNGGVIDV